MRNKQGGITLIALVITIIVLLILAGVAISTLAGENGLINKTTSARIKSIISEAEEVANLGYTSLMIDRLTGVTPEEQTTAILQELNKNGFETETALGGSTTINGVSLMDGNNEVNTALTLQSNSEPKNLLIRLNKTEDQGTEVPYLKLEGLYYEIKISDKRVSIDKDNPKTSINENASYKINIFTTNLDGLVTINGNQITQGQEVQSGQTVVITPTEEVVTNGEIQLSVGSNTTRIGVTIERSYTITTAKEGLGTIYPEITSQSYQPGDEIQLTATPENGHRFVGWYNGSTLLSSDSSYKHTVNQEAIIVGKFAEIQTAEQTLVINPSGTTEKEISPFVYYVDKNGQNILCRVLYSKNQSVEINGQLSNIEEVQIVPISPVEDLYIGPTTSITENDEYSAMTCYDEAKKIYNNSYDNMTEYFSFKKYAVDNYLNSKLSPNEGARCFGSSPVYVRCTYDEYRDWDCGF